MTVITHARRKSRLSKIIDEAGGFSVGTALAQAKANLDALQPRSAAEVADRIAELGAITAPEHPEQNLPTLGAAYRAANGVIDSAGPFGMDDLHAAAVGLCDLIDAATPERPFDWRVLPVYAQSMQLLLALSEDAEARQKVRESLQQMVSRKLAQTD
jgi:hypothetical protein